jgi:hypothetical protein
MLKAKLEACEDVLRSLAAYVGAGGYNAETVDPAVFDKKIRWGIDHATDHHATLMAERAAMQDENDMLRHDLREANKANPSEAGES